MFDRIIPDTYQVEYELNAIEKGWNIFDARTNQKLDPIALAGKSMYIDPLSPVYNDLASPIFNDPSPPCVNDPQSVFNFK